MSTAADLPPLILVVDDNEQNRALVEVTLEEEGHRVLLASGGEEALRAFDQHLPDCVLLDVRMPGTDGLTVPELLRRVLENLLDNALRYAPAGSEVTARVVVQAETVLLTMADQGSGVPPSMRERVFERLVRADGAEGGRGSYGLGLAFCKLAVEQLGGRIWVEDGKPGAVFSVSMQRAA